MTAIAPHIAAFLRERLPHQRGASVHTCEAYAYAFKLLFEWADENQLRARQITDPIFVPSA
jgi:site-specific recombinase XerC